MDLSLLLICLGVVAVASATADRRPTCPMYCDCSRGTETDFEVTCPGAPQNSSFQVFYTANKLAKIKCSADLSKKNEDLEMLRGLALGPVQSVRVEMCHVDFSLPELFDKLNISQVQSFAVKYSNITNGLNRSMFTNYRNITRLEVTGSGISFLPEDLLADLNKLTSLDLRENEFELPVRFFQNVPKLATLELGGNKIHNLSPDAFQNLSQLKLLNLWGNALEDIPSNLFQDLKMLVSLDLQNNALTQLSSDAFEGLERLQFLDLSKNNLSSLPEGLFMKTRQLKQIFVSGNPGILLPPGLLSNLTNLTNVHLSGNNLTDLPANLLWGCSSLTSLALQFNKLTDFPQDFFRDTKSLQTLDISNNNLQDLRNNVFTSITNLKRLYLSNNKLTTITENAFRGLDALEELKLDRNQLRHIDNQAFRGFRRLRTINLSHNNLIFDPMYNSPLQHCVKLQKLLLGNNSLSEIFNDWQVLLTELTELDLRYNNITTIKEIDLLFLLAKNLVVDLRFNQITVIEVGFLDPLIGAQPARTNENLAIPVKFRLNDNPLDCNCKIYQLLRYVELKLQPHVYGYIELTTDNLRCSTPYEVSNVSISNLKSQTLQCRLSQAEMNNEECPGSCTCWERPYGKAFIVDCSDVDLETAPDYLPRLPKRCNHTEVHLERNKLVALPNAAQLGYGSVSELYASHNKIMKLQLDNIPASLEVLAVDYNNLARMDSSTIKRLANGTKLKLINAGNNPWVCDCDALDLVNFLQSNYKKVEHSANMTCNDGRKLTKLSADDLCALPVALIISSSLSIAILGIIIGTLAALYYRYQREIKVWLFAHNLCLSLVTEHELDKDKHYDAFVSYSHQDEDFVVNDLVPGLESGPTPFKLCLHFRDWVAGEWIPNQIARSVEDSRRTMVILSPNFLESVWGRMEFRAAHSQALSEGRARVIVVLYGDVGPLEGLDPELKAYLSMNTYVKWGDPWFWDKLRYALPHPPQMMKKMGVMIMPPDLRVNTTREDKMELEPTTPSATTPPATILMNPLIQGNGHIIPITNNHAKLISENGHNLNGYVKSI